MSVPDRVSVVEVGLRDGIQNEKRLISTAMKLEAVNMLYEAGVRYMQLASFVHPKRVPQMADAEDLFKAHLPSSPQYSALVLNMKGLDRAIEAGVKWVDLSVSCSESHSLSNVGLSLEDSFAMLDKMLSKAKSNNLGVRVGLQCAFVCKQEGPLPRERLKAIVANLSVGLIDCLALADSPGLATPSDIYKTFTWLKEVLPDMSLAAHIHDTKGLAVSNMWAAYEAGVRIFDTSFGGLGGCPFIENAHGNLSTEDAVRAFEGVGIETGIQLEKVRQVTALISTFLKSGQKKRNIEGVHESANF